MPHAIAEAIDSLDTASGQIVGLVHSRVEMSEGLESFFTQILDQLKSEGDRIRIMATYRDFVRQLRARLCDDMHLALGPEGLETLGWEGVTWNRVKDKLEVEMRRQRLEPTFRGLFSEMFERVLAARGLDRNDFDMLMRYRKQATDVLYV